jgi:hypothetical protein
MTENECRGSMNRNGRITRVSAFWKILEMSWEGSEPEGRLGEKNLEAKYQNTAILITPVSI